MESRASDKSSKADNYVLHKCVEFISTGITIFGCHDITFFRNISGIYFNPKLSKRHNYLKSYPTVELADLVSYPIYRKFKNNDYNGRDWLVVEKKLLEYPDYIGKGLKYFPNKEVIDYYDKLYKITNFK